MKHSSKITKNGFQVISIENDCIDSTTVLFLFKAGSIYENKNNSGVSHMIEHFVFKGNEKERNTKVLLQKLFKYTVEYNAYTSQNMTGFYFKTITKNSIICLELFLDMLFRSIFPYNEIVLERKVVLEEFKRYEHDEDEIFEKNILNSVLKNTSYRNPILGNKKSIVNLSLKDIKKYYRQYYQIKNCKIVIFGNSNKKLLNKIENYNLKNIKKNPSFECKNLVLYPKIKKNYSLKIFDADSNMSNLAICFVNDGFSSKNKDILKLIDNILVGNLGSRLSFILREKYGLIYELESSITTFSKCGYFQINLLCDCKNLIKIINLIFKEIKMLRSINIPTDELERNKNNLIDKNNLKNENTVDYCDVVGEDLLINPNFNMENLCNINFKKNILNISAENVKNYAKNSFTKEKLSIILNLHNDKMKSYVSKKVEKSIKIYF